MIQLGSNWSFLLWFSALSAVGTLVIIRFTDEDPDSVQGDAQAQAFPADRFTDRVYESVELPPVLLSKPGKITHQFTLRNDTEKQLTLNPPSASCGCSTPTLDRTTLLPGECASLTCNVKLGGQSKRLKNVSVSVSASSGRSWRYLLAIPVLPRVIAPPRVNLKIKTAAMYTDDAIAAEQFCFSMYDTESTTLSEFEPQFSSTDPGLRVDLLGHTDSAELFAGKTFQRRDYDVLLQLHESNSHSPDRAVIWSAGGIRGTIYVHFSDHEQIQSDPRVLIIRGIPPAEVTLTLSSLPEDQSAQLSAVPPFLAPLSAAMGGSSANHVFRFSVDSKKLSPHDYVVFSLARNGIDVGEFKVPVICLMDSRQAISAR